MSEDINKKLDTILELLNKILEKQNATVSFGNLTSYTNAFGKEYNINKENNFPTPWNDLYNKPTKPEDELYD